jgi:hypothetical protein
MLVLLAEKSGEDGAASTPLSAAENRGRETAILSLSKGVVGGNDPHGLGQPIIFETRSKTAIDPT